MSAANSFWATLNRVSLVKQIIIGLLLGTLVGYLGSGSSPLVSAQTVAGIGILGNMFVVFLCCFSSHTEFTHFLEFLKKKDKDLTGNDPLSCAAICQDPRGHAL